MTLFTQAIIDLTRELHAKTLRATCAWCGKVLHDGPRAPSRPTPSRSGFCGDTVSRKRGTT